MFNISITSNTILCICLKQSQRNSPYPITETHGILQKLCINMQEYFKSDLQYAQTSSKHQAEQLHHSGTTTTIFRSKSRKDRSSANIHQLSTKYTFNTDSVNPASMGLDRCRIIRYFGSSHSTYTDLSS
jgi:activator of HSP90 ATPase